jgi:hypothetical protein
LPFAIGDYQRRQYSSKGPPEGESKIQDFLLSGTGYIRPEDFEERKKGTV